MVHGSSFMADVSSFMDPFSWLLVHRSCLLAHCSWLPVHRSWLLVHGAWLLVHGPDKKMTTSNSSAARTGSGFPANQPLIRKSLFRAPVWPEPVLMLLLISP